MKRLSAFSAAVGVALAWAVALPASAAAHGTSGKETLGIPRYVFAWAASVVLVLSFVGLAALWSRPRLEGARERVVLRLPRVLDPLCGALGVAVFGVAVYAGLAGEQSDPQRNLLPVLVYVHFWVGLAFLSLLLGDVYRAFNPWRAVARAAGALAGAVGLRPRAPFAYPARLGRWPAALGILAFAAIELVFSADVTPRALAVLAIVCAVTQLAGMALFGIERWSTRADPFGVFFGLFARLSPLHWERARLSVRRPLAGLTAVTAIPGTVALICVMIGTTSFDGLESTSTWRSTFPDATQIGRLTGMFVMVAIITSVYLIGAYGMRTVGTPRTARYLAGRFAHSLVPIALAYVVAHYVSLLATEGQALGYLVSDPLGDGSDLFGTADWTVNLGVISATAVWLVQVGALVAGHVSGLASAHDRALVVYEGKAAAQSQYWMLAVMVGFTCLGLWLLSA
jgi:hypothetical protein